MVVLIAALNIALGGVAAGMAAAPGQAGSRGANGHRPASPAAPASRITWRKLPLSDGWQSEDSAYHTGDPSWAVRGGIVYLSGSMHSPSSSSADFGVLPPAARPAHFLVITVYTFNGTTGYLVVNPNGLIAVLSAPFSDAQSFTSLAAVSFPARTTARHKLTLLHGWKPSPASVDTGDPSYSVVHGVVYLSGSLRQPTGFNQLFAVLPRTARPAQGMAVTVFAGAHSTGDLTLEPNGDMYASLAGARTFTSLAAVSYPAAAITRHKLTLRNGWTLDPHRRAYGSPSYSVAGGVVYLSGAMVQSPAGGNEFAVLPQAARPAHYLYIKAYTGAGAVGFLLIAPNGTMRVFGTAARGFTSLAAISYPVRS